MPDLPSYGGVLIHQCDPPVVNPNRDHMEAFDTVYINPDGTMHISNGEYGSQVNFCPWCGKKAAKQL